jgi:predicted nucleic acid-binding protein
MKGAVYVETSAVLRIVLEGDRALASRLGKAKKLVTSTLTRLEAARGLARAEREQRIDRRQLREGAAWLRNFFRSCDLMAMDDDVVERAAVDFPVEPIRTLDALHLAAALLWESNIGSMTVVSCDDRIRDNAAALGMKIHPPSSRR